MKAVVFLFLVGCGGAVSPVDDAAAAPDVALDDAAVDAAVDASADAPIDAACGKSCTTSADGSVIFWDSCKGVEYPACTLLCQDGDASACL